MVQKYWDNKNRYLGYLSRKECYKCGKKDNLITMNKEGKINYILQLFNKPIKVRKEYLKKCEVICRDCNRKKLKRIYINSVIYDTLINIKGRSFTKKIEFLLDFHKKHKKELDFNLK